MYSGNPTVGSDFELSNGLSNYKFIQFWFLSSAGNWIQELYPAKRLSEFTASFIINGTFNQNYRYFLLKRKSDTVVNVIERSGTTRLDIYGIK